MTIKEVAEHIGKHNDTIRRAIQSGKLEATKVNRVWDISDEALSAYMQAQGISTDALGNAEGYAQPYAEDMQSIMQQLRSENERQREQIADLQEQLREAREELREARQAAEEASHRHDTVMLQMTRLLEYEQLPFWRKLFSRKALPPPEQIMDMEPGDDKSNE